MTEHLLTPEIYESTARYRKSLRKNRLCLYPGCASTTPIIRAHSVSRQQNLVPIARDSHVYWTHFDDKDMLKEHFKPKPYRQGISVATTFRGFCSEHDAIFNPIDQDSHCSNPLNLFLHAYRTLAAECWWRVAKRDAHVAQIGEFQLRTMLTDKPVLGLVKTEYDELEFLIWTHFKLKELFDEVLLDQNWGVIRGYEIEFERKCPIATAIGHKPSWTFDAKHIFVDIYEHMEAPLLFSALLPTVTGSKLIISYHSKTEPYIRPFIESLEAMPDNRKSDALLRLYFMHNGNLAISPEWWEKLDPKHKEYLSDIMHFNMISNSYSWEYIIDRGIEIEDWGVTKSGFILHSPADCET